MPRVGLMRLDFATFVGKFGERELFFFFLSHSGDVCFRGTKSNVSVWIRPAWSESNTDVEPMEEEIDF